MTTTCLMGVLVEKSGSSAATADVAGNIQRAHAASSDIALGMRQYISILSFWTVAFSIDHFLGTIVSERTRTDPRACTFEQQHSACQFAHSGSIRVLLLACECNIKTKFHLVRRTRLA